MQRQLAVHKATATCIQHKDAVIGEVGFEAPVLRHTDAQQGWAHMQTCFRLLVHHGSQSHPPLVAPVTIQDLDDR
eukprot:1161704-Pelagomonas_calceolata.AAC.4